MAGCLDLRIRLRCCWWSSTNDDACLDFVEVSNPNGRTKRYIRRYWLELCPPQGLAQVQVMMIIGLSAGAR